MLSLKTGSRIVHLVSTGLLSGIVTLNYLFGVNEYLSEESSFSKLNAIAGFMVFATGIANIFLVKAGKKLEGDQKMWIHMFELKFFLALLLTPFIKPLQAVLDFSDEFKVKFQFAIVCVIMVYSVAIKAFREDVLNNFESDVF
jgi:hypothetical protein